MHEQVLRLVKIFNMVLVMLGFKDNNFLIGRLHKGKLLRLLRSFILNNLQKLRVDSIRQILLSVEAWTIKELLVQELMEERHQATRGQSFRKNSGQNSTHQL